MTELADFERVEVSDADVEAVMECLRSGWLTMGPRIQAFEKAFAERCGVEHAIAVSHGLSGLHLSFAALGLGRGDEVVVPALGTGRAANAVRSTGAVPVGCDVRSAADPVLDSDALEHALSERTRAVVVAHPLGHVAPVEDLLAICEASGVPVVEDATDALGAVLADGRPAGTAGALGCFDLSVGSQLPIGEGGMVCSSDEALAARVRSLRSHAMTSVTWDRHRGHADSYDVVDIGFNFRMDEPRAALGLSRLERLDEELERRHALAGAWRAELRDAYGVELVWDDVSGGADLALAVLLGDSDRRDAAADALRRAGVDSRPAPIESVPLTPNAAIASERMLLLPLGEAVTQAEVSAGAAALR